MKHIIISGLIACIPLLANATQWTVSNDPLRPAQFATIQDAIDAASDGDTLIVAGSETNYAGFTLEDKGLVIIGEGANDDNATVTVVSGTVNFKRFNNTASASGSIVEAILFTQSVSFNANFSGSTPAERTLDNMVFNRCLFGQSSSYGSNGSYTNHAYRNCAFTTSSAALNFSGSNTAFDDIEIKNCVLSQGTINGQNVEMNEELRFKNCLFLNRTTDIFINVDSARIENCIFYKAEPTGAVNSKFNNCLTYICNSNTIPYGSNAGTGNIINMDPMFNSYPSLGGSFDWAHNYGLMVGSPANGAGTGGTDIGLTGGDYPLEQLVEHSHLPVVTSLSLPNSSVPVNGTLQGNIQAMIQD